ncbi:7-deoxyloganetic acid glucosyltransferase-like [Coffea eugenioides]|uniref:7-deoxyloganetic acid glucosyltransferase-like n=1 Tax=Coffea eugenioides TaxID=49369 RepID=UPI000F60F98C|nr:7-deoxyloganetic acid glucosyltransferase-like [Coffea eugenioides]
MDHQDELVPHVLIFPLPIQSPVNSMLKLAELLCLAGLHVTFLNTKHNHNRLLRCTNIQSRLDQYQGRFHLENVDDGIPDEDPRTVEQFAEILDSWQSVAEPFLRVVLSGERFSCNSSKRPPVTCIIADGLYYYVLDVAEEMGIPFIFFETISPCCLWVYMCIPKLIETGELPFKGNDLDAEVRSIPGMEGLLRRRDLPDFCRRDCTADRSAQLVMAEIRNIPRAAGLILNTFEALEGPFLSHIHSQAPNLYAIGPLQLHLKTKLAAQSRELPAAVSNSFWVEDASCLCWLDSQPLKSVIYISFGSLRNITKDEFLEFWHGIVNSGQRFLWVIRPGSINGQKLEQHDDFLKELNEDTKERGLILSWVPQEEVIGHPAIGGFLTHSGWNSTLESIIAGVPMICWPCYVDQQVTSRFVSETWTLGLDMKDTCNRSIIEKKIRDIIERRSDFDQSADKWSKLARQSVAAGGSSHFDLDRLIRDIKMLSLKGDTNASFHS